VWLGAVAVAALLVVPRALPDAPSGASPGASPRAMPTPEAPTGVGDVTGLTPALRRAVRLATDAAAADGVTLTVTSGWRSAEHQERLYRDAIAKYGSPSAARRWVLPPGESAHVRGEAVDVGPPQAAAWLERHGVRWGLCRRYANEPWHFERLAAAKGSQCPPMEPHA
jgi:LAS superfamily LD-carboxypeptidase LdcB